MISRVSWNLITALRAVGGHVGPFPAGAGINLDVDRTGEDLAGNERTGMAVRAFGFWPLGLFPGDLKTNFGVRGKAPGHG